MEYELDIFDPDSIETVLFQLNAARQSLPLALKNLTDELADIGYMKAVETYGSPLDNGDVRVHLVPLQGANPEYELYAEGEDVFFAEFGTGVETHAQRTSSVFGDGDLGDEEMYASLSMADIFPGSWSIEHQQEFVLYGKWWYKGKEFTGTPPRPGMQRAINAMKRERPRLIEDFVEQLFK